MPTPPPPTKLYCSQKKIFSLLAKAVKRQTFITATTELLS